jgi:hyperosmotically inducible periplasmic protein
MKKNRASASRRNAPEEYLSMRRILSIGLAVLLAGALGSGAWAAAPVDQALQAALAERLASKPQYQNVRVAVDDRIATLTGTVDNLRAKLDAERTARKYRSVAAVVNHIEVAGPEVPDAELAQRLARRMAADRSFQDNVFNFFRLGVEDGVITISGYAYGYPARDSALALARNASGARDVVDRIEVLPLSRNDDRIRVQAVRRIYNATGLGRYAMNPAHPIRVIVKNGHVTLEGAVLNEMDRTLAGMAANAVSGVFSVTNNLEVSRS